MMLLMLQCATHAYDFCLGYHRCLCLGRHWLLLTAVTWISCILQDVWDILASQLIACHRDVMIAL